MATAVRDPLAGRLVDGRYQVRSRIARGGMATVYLATDTRLDRPVALKVMHPHLAEDPSFVARFTREARSAARLSHPGVVAVFDQGTDDGLTYLAMEHVPGTTLRDVLGERGPLPLREALALAEQVLDALAAAHRAGLVHRDVKPENVLVGDDGRLRVADFGLARAASTTTGTSTSTLMGTVGYLAPELVLHGTADARADVYAAGVVLFELLTGARPFAGGVPAQVAFRHVHEDVAPPSSLRPALPRDVDDLVARATERDPSRRPADAGELLAALRGVRAGLSAADLDRAPVTAAPARDGATAVVRRERVLALPVGEDPRAGARVAARAGASVVRRGPAPARVRRRAVLVLVAALVLAVAGTAAWAVLAGPLRQVGVPRVVGADQLAARSALRARGLFPDPVERYDERVPAGGVVSTRPGAGTPVRTGSTVVVVVSRGPRLFAVPVLTGRTRARAEAAVTAAHLGVGVVGQEWSPTVPAGAVLSQQTGTDVPLRSGSPVAFTVSKGRRPVPVPTDLATMGQQQAADALRAAGLAVGTVRAEASDTVAAGAVVRSTPAGGTLFGGDRVDLVVSSGPAVVAVPDVVGRRLDDAQRALRDAGLRVEVTEVLGGFLGVVRAQDPAGGTARRGSTVTLTVL